MPGYYYLPTVLLLYIAACTAAPGAQAPGDARQDLPSDSLRVARQAAEYDPQEAIWLIWPYQDHAVGYSADAVTLAIVKAVAPHQTVHLTARNEEQLQEARAAIPAVLQESGRVFFHQIPSMELWVRDMGPNFVTLTDGRQAVVDFNFNSWGYSSVDDPYSQTEEKYDERLAAHLGLPLLSSDLISEGGNREVNGEGVLLLVSRVSEGRNPDWARAEMEREFKRLLGVEKIIWLPAGVYEDDHTFRGPLTLADGSKAYTVVTTDGHIDEFARFVNDSTILLAEVPAADLHDPIAQENKRRMDANYEILRQATDHAGRPFHIIRVPTPPTIVRRMKPGDSVYDYISTLDY
ncbi:MAG: agmatine deiminase family protein, partial [Bacteroidetes bacterium]